MLRPQFALRQMMMAVAAVGAVLAFERWMLMQVAGMARHGDAVSWWEVLTLWSIVHGVLLAPVGAIAYTAISWRCRPAVQELDAGLADPTLDHPSVAAVASEAAGPSDDRPMSRLRPFVRWIDAIAIMALVLVFEKLLYDSVIASVLAQASPWEKAIAWLLFNLPPTLIVAMIWASLTGGGGKRRNLAMTQSSG